MKEIKLTQGQVALVDDEDYEYLNQFIWQAAKHRNTYYSTRHSKAINGLRTTLRMHREILKLNKGAICDHIDGNGLNNQKNNLRLVTASQNSMNSIAKKIKLNSRSKYKGAYPCTGSKTWKAIIMVRGKSIRLGTFKTEIDAAIAYNEAALKYHGEFARLNILS